MDKIFELTNDISIVAMLIKNDEFKLAFHKLASIIDHYKEENPDTRSIEVTYSRPLVSVDDFIDACARILYHLSVALISKSSISLNNAKSEINNLYLELAKVL